MTDISNLRTSANFIDHTDPDRAAELRWAADEIEQLRAALQKIADDNYEAADWDGEGMPWQNVARKIINQQQPRTEKP